MPARLIAAFCVMALPSLTFAADPLVNPAAIWTGKIQDESLRQLAPQSSLITNAETWKTLWTAWRPNGELPKVDFAKELIFVGTVPGPNLVSVHTTIDDSGNVRLTVAGTEMAGPGFGYKLVKIGIDSVKTINGKVVNDERACSTSALSCMSRCE